jgi:hypothetical protein
VRIARAVQKSLFSGRIKIQGVGKIKNADNKGFSRGAILRENKNAGVAKISKIQNDTIMSQCHEVLFWKNCGIERDLQS